MYNSNGKIDYEDRCQKIEKALLQAYEFAPNAIINKYSHLFLFVKGKKTLSCIKHKRFTLDTHNHSLISIDRKKIIPLSNNLALIFIYILKTHLAKEPINKLAVFYNVYGSPANDGRTYDIKKDGRLMSVQINALNKKIKEFGLQIKSRNKHCWYVQETKI